MPGGFRSFAARNIPFASPGLRNLIAGRGADVPLEQPSALDQAQENVDLRNRLLQELDGGDEPPPSAGMVPGRRPMPASAGPAPSLQELQRRIDAMGIK